MRYFVFRLGAWDGPYDESCIVTDIRSQLLRRDIWLCRESDGVVLRGDRLLGPSLLMTCFKFAAICAGAWAAYKMVERTKWTAEQRSIRASTKRHENRGAEVLADHVGRGHRPPVMNGRIADVVAFYGNGRVVVEEHETISSAQRHHSMQQDLDLRAWAKDQRLTRYEQVVVDD